MNYLVAIQDKKTELSFLKYTNEAGIDIKDISNEGLIPAKKGGLIFLFTNNHEQISTRAYRKSLWQRKRR